MAPGGFDDIAHLSPATAHHGLDERNVGLMPMHVDRAIFHTRSQKVDAPMGLFGRDLAVPLERRLGLRHKQRARDGDLHAAARLGRRGFLRSIVSTLSKARDALDIVIGLGRKADHEVKLAATPTSSECRVDGAK